MKLVSSFLLAAATVGVVTSESAPPVPVELYYESQCPGCQDFITSTLKNVLAKPDMAAIIALKMVPYGNTKQNADGSFTCQHGEGECASDVYELCTEYKLSGNIESISTGDTSAAAFPFILCMEEAEGTPTQAQSCYESTMNTTALPWSVINDCSNKEGDAVQTQAMKATVAHDYVPWCLVNGALLENTSLLQKAVCDAYTGVPPASCKLSAEQESGRCKNN